VREQGTITLTGVYWSVFGIESGTTTPTLLFIILNHLNVGRPVVILLIKLKKKTWTQVPVVPVLTTAIFDQSIIK
jgi:hypothetical protein